MFRDCSAVSSACYELPIQKACEPVMWVKQCHKPPRRPHSGHSASPVMAHQLMIALFPGGGQTCDKQVIVWRTYPLVN